MANRKPINVRIVVIGTNGMLGYAISEYFSRKNYRVIKISRNGFDIINDPLSKLSRRIKKNDVVINCAGVIKPQIEDNKLEDILIINGTFPKNLANICLKKKAICFHITTDCVFSGKKGNYIETDIIDADDIYGLSKSAGDNSNSMTLRTSIIGEEKGRNRSLLEWIKSNKHGKVNGFTNHKWNGVTTVYMAEIIEKIILMNLYQAGIFHIFSIRSISKYHLLMTINKIYQLRIGINKVISDQRIDRSLDSIYSLSSKVSTKSIAQQVVELREFFRK